MSADGVAGSVDVVDDGAVRRIVLHNDDGNRLTYPMLERLHDVLSATTPPSVRVLVLAGAGADLCTGDALDPSGVPARWRDRCPAGRHGPPPVVEQEVVGRLRELPMPTLAMMRGRTFGLGLDLAAACDVRVASDDAAIGDDRIGRGQTSSVRLSWLLPRLVGLSQAIRVMLLGDTLDGSAAERIGLVHRCWPAATFAAEADALIGSLAAMPTRAYAVHKVQVLPQLELGFAAALIQSLAVRQTHVIEDTAEGLAAWRERRPPAFTGR